MPDGTYNAESSGIDLTDLKAEKLWRVAYSAVVEVEGRKEEALEPRLKGTGVSFGADGWTKAGKPFDIKERPIGASGPSDVTERTPSNARMIIATKCWGPSNRRCRNGLLDPGWGDAEREENAEPGPSSRGPIGRART